MKKTQFDPEKNYIETREKIGYVPRTEATQETYDKIGFMSGLEVHQQLLTEKKLFCHCKAGVFHKNEEFDAEIVRHMRPTLSELGEYDGTALMEFKTKKEIVYRINNENACTYEVDDTPPFIINKEALNKALQITMLSKFNLVGEVHITRKQYLDGSIPTGFQRTAILGVEGEIQLRNKKVRLIQLSIEEDSCREISDIGHRRIYKTDRLGMPLIETVTYPDMVNPDEVKEACDYIRFLNRSSNNVRIGMGATRQDVNVSCKGGTRIEIKGVAHTKWIPELTHNECFRQWALLAIQKELKNRFASENEMQNWKTNYAELNFDEFKITTEAIKQAKENNHKLIAVNIPKFKGILSHFTQPGKCFADEISDRLKVIACIEKPNMIHNELPNQPITPVDMEIIQLIMQTDEENDSLIIFWAPEADVKTALETIEERCKMAFFEGVPKETRKSFENGTTIFERVLPGADRMYPDTDSTPIPLDNNELEELRKNIPEDVCERINQFQKWQFPEDTFTYLLSKNLFSIIKQTIDLDFNPKFIAKLFGHFLKNYEGKNQNIKIDYNKIIELLKFIKNNHLECEIAFKMLPKIFTNIDNNFENILSEIKFKKYSQEEILSKIDSLSYDFDKVAKERNTKNKIAWIMEELRDTAIGNINLTELKNNIANRI
ncbi:MAG: Glu-tRNA(Gln) amidotransferase subunit GatE [Bacteroidales bacterium]|jgi:glutamyl-tRNA(Gln) amidotransferase subunit E|nr:Glu-tRNA(Gln) amidotransferase subunit GatE [Bacteroidales bacterium]